MSQYRYHLFICTNQKVEGKPCCENYNASEIKKYTEQRVRDLNLWSKGNVRVNEVKCLGRCKVGPVMVIYPNEVWYRCTSVEDADKIIQEHLIEGNVVEELLLPE